MVLGIYNLIADPPSDSSEVVFLSSLQAAFNVHQKDEVTHNTRAFAQTGSLRD